MTPRVVLVGLPGSGKSTSGRRLAKMLGVGFVDSDDLVEESAGRSISTVFAESGEEAFRALESSCVQRALRTFDGVLALGGGALSWAPTRAAVLAAGAPVVLLRAGLQTLTMRVGDGHTRPLLADDPSGRLGELAAARESTYRECATLTVDTDERTPGQVAAQIAARLHEEAARP